jgi:uncharacterized membrane protein
MDAITVILLPIAVTALIIALNTRSRAALLLDRVVRLERELRQLTSMLGAAGAIPEQAPASAPARPPRDLAAQASPPPLVATASMVGAAAVDMLETPGPLEADARSRFEQYVATLMPACPSCGTPVHLDAAFCGECGATLRAPRGTPVLERLIGRARGTEEWEALIGGRWMNRIGAVALILGMGFFLKYAFDSNWISQSLRILIGVIVGAGLLLGAWRSHTRGYAIFAQGLVGAGTATLYLSVYASFNFYHLIPQPVALAAMALVTAVGLIQALYYDSLAVALLAWIGGFVTLPLLGLGQGDELGLLGYLTLLDAGMLGIVFARDRWFILEPLTMGATYATYLAWYASSYSSGKLGLAAVSVTVLAGLFYALDVSRIRTGTSTHRVLRHVLGAANALAYYGAMFALLHDHSSLMGLITIGIGSVYMSTILLAKRRLRRDDGLDARFTLTAVVLAIIAAPIIASGFVVVILWSLEAVLLLWCGVRRNLWYIWRPALWLLTLSSLFLLATNGALAYAPIERFTPLFNQRALAFLTLAAALAASTWVLRRLDDRRKSAFVASLHYAWCSIIFILITVETSDHFRQAMAGSAHLTTVHLEFVRTVALSALWMAYSLPLVWYGRQKRIFPIFTTGLAIVALSVGMGAAIGVSYQPIERFTPVLNLRVGLLLLLIAGLLVHSRWIRQEAAAQPWIGAVKAAYQGAIVLLGFELLTSEIHDFFRHHAGALSEQAGASGFFIELMTLAAIWMLYSLPLVRYGLRNRALPVLLTGLGSAGAATGIGAVAALAYTPTHWLSLAISLRPIVLLFLVAGLFVHMRWADDARKAFAWLDAVRVALQAAIVLLGFELISAETHDVFQYHVALAQSGAAEHWRNLEQLTLSIIWMLYAVVLMGFGLWRRTRWLRLGALALLAFIILKIFVYDLSFLTGAYRSISFAGLGVILIGLSFVYQRYRSLILGAVR